MRPDERAAPVAAQHNSKSMCALTQYVVESPELVAHDVALQPRQRWVANVIPTANKTLVARVDSNTPNRAAARRRGGCRAGRGRLSGHGSGPSVAAISNGRKGGEV